MADLLDDKPQIAPPGSVPAASAKDAAAPPCSGARRRRPSRKPLPAPPDDGTLFGHADAREAAEPFDDGIPF